MKVKNKIFIIALILSLMLSVTAVAASDDITFDQSDIQAVSDETDMELSREETTLAANTDEDDSSSQGEGENQILSENKNHTVEGSDFTNIQQAITSSSEGDTIFLDGKTYNGSSPIKVNVNNLTIIGGSAQNPDEIATLDGMNLARIMEITASNVVIKGIIFVNATSSGDGGAVSWSGANGKLENSIFKDNHANRYAGAIYWTGLNGIVEGTGFINNTAYGNSAAAGGAIFWNAANATIKNSIFINNSANYGGAVHIAKENSTFEGCVFENNEATYNSGGALRLYGDNVKITNSRFTDNKAAANGGAVFAVKSNNVISNSNFTGNHANSGGGIFFDTNTADSKVVDCNFINNTLRASDGAGILWKGSNGILINSNFTNNRAGINGGGVRFDGKNASIMNCDFTGNVAVNAALTGGSGGGLFIAASSANATVSDSRFYDNVAHDYAGGMWSNAQNTTVIDSYFENNTAYHAGALFFHATTSNSKIYNSNFVNNSARSYGGAVRIDGPENNITYCNFTGNFAEIHGGAVVFGVSSLNGRLNNCNFTSNIANSYGGAVSWFGVDGILNDCDFKYNSAGNGGAVNWDTTSPAFQAGSNGTLFNCNFINNNAVHAGGAVRWNAFNGTVYDCYILNNTANYGASLVAALRSSNFKISECDFIANTAKTSTGGIRIDQCNNATVTDCNFINNTALTGGSAGLYVQGKDVKVLNSKFINNTGAQDAGAIIWNYADSTNGILSNCEFVNNSANNGGAIRWDGSNGTLSNCNFTGNSAASNSGAILLGGENATLNGCNFIGNSAKGQGAVNSKGANANISNCNFTGNSAIDNNGALAISGANSIIKDSSFTNNNANKSQGALGIASGGVGTVIDGCHFENNSASNSQGAVVIDAANVRLTNSSFENNRAGNYGGAVSLRAVNGTLSDCNFTNNFANQSGGALFVNENGINATMSGCELTGNRATDSGGSIRWGGANGTISDSEFTANTAKVGGVIHSVADGLNITQNSFKDNEAEDAGSVFWIDGNNNSISGNEINHASSDKTPIYATDVSNLNFDGDANLIHNAKLIMEVEDRFVGHIGKVIDIPIYVHDDLGIPAVGDVTINGYGSKALVGGKASFEIDLPNEVTSFSLVVIYDKLAKEVKVDVVNNDHPIDEIVQPNDHADDIVVKLPKDATGNVTVVINDKNYTAEVSNGEAVIPINDLKNGMYQATVIYSGDRKYPGMSKIMHVVIENSIIDPVTKILLNEDVTVIYSGTASYKVLVTKYGGIVGAGESVTFNFNGRNTVVKTDARGYATFTFKADVKVKTYNIKATYYGNTVTNKVKVTQIIKASDKKVKKSKKVTKIKITLNKVNGKYLSKKTLKIKFNKKTYKVKTNKKGVATWKVKKSMLKKLKVGKKVKYTVTYGKATLTKKLIIKR